MAFIILVIGITAATLVVLGVWVAAGRPATGLHRAQ